MLALVSDAFGGRGGIAQYNRDFLNAVAMAQDVKSVEILPRHATDGFTLPIKLRQERPGRSRISYVRRALTAALTKRPDIVFCGHINLAPLAVAVSHLCGAKIIVQTHGIEAWSQPSNLYKCALEEADLVFCVSRYTRARLLSWAAIAPERALVIPNTVGQAFVPGDASELRNAWKLNGKRVLLTVARTEASERYKGHELVIAALHALPQDVVYVVLGAGNDLERIKDIAYRAGLGARVYFKHAVNRDTLIAAYRMADLYVMPSSGEGFGIAFLEAMASGTPALGLDVAGAPDALADGALGTMTSVERFPSVLAQLLTAGRPNPQELSSAVTARFGLAAFVARVHSALDRLSGTDR